jgi:anti-sigma B factor antagonist
METSEQLVITEEVPTAGVAVIAIAGQVDLYSAPELKRAVTRAIDGGAKQLVIDLTRTGFMDSSGLGVLVGAMKRLRKGGGSVEIVCPDPGIRRLFELAGLSNVFPLHESRDELPQH